MAIPTYANQRSSVPKHPYQALAPAADGDDLNTPQLDWDTGIANLSNSPANIEETILEERISLLTNDAPDNNGLVDFDARDAASIAAERMSQPANDFTPENSPVNHDTGVLSTQIEGAYLHCYIAASVGLLCLSVASFTLPSMSTYPPERTAVQILSYTAGVISLLSGLAAGASVLHAYAGSGYLHR